MTPPQKQPAVTKEQLEAERQFYNNDDPLWVMASTLLTERDEAIREVGTTRAELRRTKADLEEAIGDLSQEKRRTAAYREVAKRKHGNWSLKIVDAEARKLLADSGGEKNIVNGEQNRMHEFDTTWRGTRCRYCDKVLRCGAPHAGSSTCEGCNDGVNPGVCAKNSGGEKS